VNARIKIGFSFCILESTNIFVNLLFVFLSLFNGIVFKFKLWKAKKALTKQRVGMKDGRLRKGVQSLLFKRSNNLKVSEEDEAVLELVSDEFEEEMPVVNTETSNKFYNKGE